MSAVADDFARIAIVKKARGYWRTVGRRLIRDPVSVVCALVFIVIALAAIFAPYLGMADPYQGSMIRRSRPIGTPVIRWEPTNLGATCWPGSLWRPAIAVARAASGRDCLRPGSTLGITAGYVGSFVNQAIMTIDVFTPFLGAACRRDLWRARRRIINSLVSLTIVFIPPIVRVAESVATGVRGLDFVDAARATGAGPLAIMRVHVLGNALGPIFVYATSLISVSMILAAGLSFLGLGTKPPEPEWGLMLNTLRTAIYVNPWVAALPGSDDLHRVDLPEFAVDGMRSAMDVRN
jgi:peptide/nickel transport system permease protein